MGATPKIKSDADLEMAGRELSYLQSWETTRRESARQRIELINHQLEDALTTEIEGISVTFADRRMMLEEAARTYLEKHRDELVNPGTKTYEGNFLIASWEDGRPSVKVLDELKDKDVIHEISVKTRIATAIKKLIDGSRLFRRPLEKFIRHKLELNRAGILEAFSNELVTNEQLAEIHVEVEQPEEKLTIKVKPYTIESASRDARH